MKKIIKILGITTISILIGCGSNDNSSNDSSNLNNSLITGVFSDSPVQNLYYETSSGIKGLTDKEGFFQYKEGDYITFKIGNLTIGTVKTSPMITPYSFISKNSNEEEVVEKAFILQNLDTDNNINNGIQLPDYTLLSNAPMDEINFSDITTLTKITEIQSFLKEKNPKYNFPTISFLDAAKILQNSMVQNYILYLKNNKTYIYLDNNIYFLEDGNIYLKNNLLGKYYINENNSTISTNLTETPSSIEVIQQYGPNIWILNINGNIAFQSENEKILQLIKFLKNNSLTNFYKDETFTIAKISGNNFSIGNLTIHNNGNIVITFDNNVTKTGNILDDGSILLNDENSTRIYISDDWNYGMSSILDNVIILTDDNNNTYFLSIDKESINHYFSILKNNGPIITYYDFFLDIDDISEYINAENEGGLEVIIN